jgi:NADH-quinone oxidoreductase subunit M
MMWSQWLPTWITLSPLLGVVLLLIVSRQNWKAHRIIGILTTFIPLILAFQMYFQFDNQMTEMQMSISVPWIEVPIGTISYAMGVDGISMPLVFLTCLISTLAAFASLYIRERTKLYYILFLLLEVGMLGVFLANDLFLFFLFFEVTLVAAFFLVGIWGYSDKEKAATQFLIYNGLGSAVMLLGIVLLFVLTGTLDFNDLPTAIAVVGQVENYETVLFVAFLSFLIAFAIKLPIYPFHSWMLRMHVEAPTPIVMILGLVNILYGAILAFVQKEFKRVLAFSSISHMGILLLGIAALNQIGLQGALFQAISHGLISALMFFLVGSMYERTKTTMLDDLGGLAKSVPVLSGLLLVAGFALLGLPGLSGFISEFLAFLGIFQVNPWLAAVGTIGLILAAVYTLRVVLKTTFGPMKDRFVGLADLRVKEILPMFVLVGFIVLIGVYPKLLEESIQVTLHQMLLKIGG